MSSKTILVVINEIGILDCPCVLNSEQTEESNPTLDISKSCVKCVLSTPRTTKNTLTTSKHIEINKALGIFNNATRARCIRVE